MQRQKAVWKLAYLIKALEYLRCRTPALTNKSRLTFADVHSAHVQNNFYVLSKGRNNSIKEKQKTRVYLFISFLVWVDIMNTLRCIKPKNITWKLLFVYLTKSGQNTFTYYHFYCYNKLNSCLSKQVLFHHYRQHFCQVNFVI